MNWQDFWNKKAREQDPFVATGRSQMNTIEFLYTVYEVSYLLNLKRTSELLDIGCGVGLLTLALAPWVKSVVGIDISADAINVARQNCSYLNNVRFKQADGVSPSYLEFLDIEGNRSHVLAYSLLQYLRDWEALSWLFKETSKALSPSGVALFAAIPDPDKKSLYLEAETEKDLSEPLLWITKRQVVELATAFGFRAVTLDIHLMIPQHKYMYNLLMRKVK